MRKPVGFEGAATMSGWQREILGPDVEPDDPSFQTAAQIATEVGVTSFTVRRWIAAHPIRRTVDALAFMVLFLAVLFGCKDVAAPAPIDPCEAIHWGKLVTYDELSLKAHASTASFRWCDGQADTVKAHWEWFDLDGEWILRRVPPLEAD